MKLLKNLKSQLSGLNKIHFIIGLILFNVLRNFINFNPNMNKIREHVNKVFINTCIISILFFLGKLGIYKTFEREVDVIITKTERVDGTYLVYTDSGVYKCEDNYLLLKFNSSDMYSSLVPNKNYKFKILGFRNRLFSTYPNIIKVKEVHKTL